MTDVLQKVDVKIMSNTQCNRLYVEANKSIRITRNQLCAGHKEGKKDACTVRITGVALSSCRNIILIGQANDS